MKTITLLTGNGQEYEQTPPKLYIITKELHKEALSHILENTSLKFEKERSGYTAQPHNFEQITALLLTYNFKTRYYNNNDWKNTLMLRFDHHIGFEVTTICLDCAKHNNINTKGFKDGGRLSC